jgi:hypothetical protein
MKIMVGIDLHSNNALCGLMDENGRRLIPKQLPCDLAAILQMLKPYQKRIATIAVESTHNWYWLVDGQAEDLADARHFLQALVGGPFPGDAQNVPFELRDRVGVVIHQANLLSGQ